MVRRYLMKGYLVFKISNPDQIKHLKLGFTVFNSEFIGLISSLSSDYNIDLNEKTTDLKVEIPLKLLHSGKYYLEAALFTNSEIYYQNDCILDFEKIDTEDNSIRGAKSKGLFNLDTSWQKL